MCYFWGEPVVFAVFFVFLSVLHKDDTFVRDGMTSFHACLTLVQICVCVFISAYVLMFFGSGL